MPNIKRFSHLIGHKIKSELIKTLQWQRKATSATETAAPTLKRQRQRQQLWHIPASYFLIRSKYIESFLVLGFPADASLSTRVYTNFSLLPARSLSAPSTRRPAVGINCCPPWPGQSLENSISVFKHSAQTNYATGPENNFIYYHLMCRQLTRPCYDYHQRTRDMFYSIIIYANKSQSMPICMRKQDGMSWRNWLRNQFNARPWGTEQRTEYIM